MSSDLHLDELLETPGLETVKEAVHGGSSAHGGGTSSEHGSAETMSIATGATFSCRHALLSTSLERLTS